MVTVEKMLKGLTTLVVKGTIKNDWHRNFLNNVHEHVLRGNPVSTNQATTILKVVGSHRDALAKELGLASKHIELAVSNPTYDRQPYESISVKREVRYIGMNQLAFRFKLDPLVVSEIKALRSTSSIYGSLPSITRFDPKYRLWIVTVTPSNLEKVFFLIQRHKFDFDVAVLEYMTLCTNSKKQASTFQAVEGEDVIVANVCSNPLLAYVVQHVLNGEPV